MSKLIRFFMPVVVTAAFGLTACTVKVQTTEEPKPTPKKEEPKPEPKPEKKKPRKLNLKGIKVKKVGNEIELPQPVPFRTGSAELDMDAGAEEVLELVRDYMATHPDVTLLRVEGHTDSDGDDNANMELSKARAAAVTAWLVANNVECKRLMPVGFGETRKLVENDTPENKAKNRRVSFFDATINNKPVLDDKKKPIPLDNGGKVAVDPCAGSK